MKTVVFTLCSNNYLAHAKTLGDSIIEKNPNVIFIIGLVDKKNPEIDYSLFSAFEIIEYDEIQCIDFPRMLSSYTIVEFNTAVKPFYIELLWERYGKESYIYYIDPDIVFYSPIEEMNTHLNLKVDIQLKNSTNQMDSNSRYMNNLTLLRAHL